MFFKNIFGEKKPTEDYENDLTEKHIDQKSKEQLDLSDDEADLEEDDMMWDEDVETDLEEAEE